MMAEAKKTLLILLVAASVIFSLLIIANIFPNFLVINKNFYGRVLTAISDPVDLEIFYIRSSWIEKHILPYKDAWQEYPPLAVLSFAIPFLFIKSFIGFKIIYTILMIFCYILLLLVNIKLLAKLNRPINYIWLFFLPSVLFSVLNRFDILPALLGQASLYLLLNKKYKSSFLTLGLATLTKVYSIFFLLPYLMFIKEQYSGRERTKKIMIGAVIFLIIILLATTLVAAFGGLSGLFNTITFTFRRAAGSGSLYAFITGLFIWHGKLFSRDLLLITYWDDFILSLLFMVPIVLAIIYVFKARIEKPRELISWMLLITLIFILFNRFYSTQWILWFLPLFILVIDSKKEIILLIIFDILNYLQFPVLMGVNAFGIPSNIITLLKSIVLFWLILIVFAKIKPTLKPQDKTLNNAQNPLTTE